MLCREHVSFADHCTRWGGAHCHLTARSLSGHEQLIRKRKPCPWGGDPTAPKMTRSGRTLLAPRSGRASLPAALGSGGGGAGSCLGAWLPALGTPEVRHSSKMLSDGWLRTKARDSASEPGGFAGFPDTAPQMARGVQVLTFVMKINLFPNGSVAHMMHGGCSDTWTVGASSHRWHLFVGVRDGRRSD